MIETRFKMKDNCKMKANELLASRNISAQLFSLNTFIKNKNRDVTLYRMS